MAALLPMGSLGVVVETEPVTTRPAAELTVDDTVRKAVPLPASVPRFHVTVRVPAL